MQKNDTELDVAKRLALGRIFRLSSRPTQEGDVAEYERCRRIVMADSPEFIDVRPNWAQDRNKGSAGD